MTATRRFLLIPGVVLISLLLAASGSLTVLALGLGLLLGGLGLLLILRYPPVGLVLLLVSSQAIPFGLGTGTQTVLNAPTLLLMILLGLWVVEMVLQPKSHTVILRSRTIPPLLAFVVVAILAFGMGQLPWFSVPGAPLRAQVGGLAIFVLSGAAFLLAGHHLRNERWLERIVWLFLALGGAYILLYHLVGGALPSVGHALGTFITRGTAGSLFWVWLISLAFAQAVFNPHLRAGLRALLWILIGGAFYVRLVLGVEWISGWLPPLVALVTILLVSGRYLAVVGTSALGILGYLNAPRIATMVMAGDNPYSLETRMAAWRILLNIFKVSPWLGLGPANYYWYTPLYPILGYYVRFNSHNNYIDLLAQTGVIGLACFLWFMWEVWKLAWRLSLEHPPGFQQAYALACLGGLAGTLVAGLLGDWVVPFVYNVGLDGFRSSMLGWLFLGGLVAMEAMLWRRESVYGGSLS